MRLFETKPKCPYCNATLPAKPTRKQKCPNCAQPILVRQGELVTEERAEIIDWLARLETFGITQRDLDRQRSQLTRQFGTQASVHDTFWRILNNLILQYASDNAHLEAVYQQMADLLSSEGEDPTRFLVEAEKARRRSQPSPITAGKSLFLGEDQLEYVHKLRQAGKLDQAEELLLKAEPSPAVLDELRKVASSKARAAKKNGDWGAVIRYLEGYTAYANQSREYCVRTVNQEPPGHTDSDSKLLKEAKQRLEN